ncbi:tRNA pseudouridine synthase Pus10-like [Uloborus diversus]|uniref:tRNA pseudouridine synthase Pus10-like n=1 Tax=Uloborus diversus TaxID=327109 RepID=UPI00240A86E7|nr:tRNA pseudouridine synthase Pus10-like [Uloborus diversus]
MNSNDVFPKVKSLLESLNVCEKCTLRFLGDKHYESYSSEISITKAFHQPSEEDVSNSSPPPKRLLPSVCASCLGLLQDSCLKRITQIQEEIAASGHVFQDFVLQVSVPVVMDLRDMLFYLFLKETFGEEYSLSATDIPSAKDAWKWVTGPLLGKATGAAFNPGSNFRISVHISYLDTPLECLPLLQKCPEAFPNRKKKKGRSEIIYTRTAVMKALTSLSSQVQTLFSLPPTSPSRGCSFEQVSCCHCPLYLGGRYNKYSRELSQTPWVVDGERRMESSVSELISDVVKRTIKCCDIVFSASGREDVDVKMLGDGRPFVLEVINPRRVSWTSEEIKNVEKEINESTHLIAVKHLQIISKQDTLLLKEGEEMKRKSYTAVCLLDRTLSQEDILKLEKVQDLVLMQKTPLRVLHRRTLSTREKLIHQLVGQIMEDDHLLRLRVVTQAGTYVKEFVHGDFGRTVPHLGDLLEAKTDILALDVESIHLDWPPPQENKS